MYIFLCILFVLPGALLAHEEDVHTVKYNVDNFEEELSKKHNFVMFYAPWCGHCQRLGPTWEQLAEMLNEDDSTIRIAKVDCTTDSRICSDNDVTGYPTLKFFKQGEKEGVRFRGTRDLPTLSNFINEQLRKGESEEEVEVVKTSSGLKELTSDNFEKHVESGKHFVKFYAPWCGHCQKLAPVWDELAQSLDANKEIGVSKIDCTQHRTICENFDVKGYPTLLWIEDGKKVEKYQGDRGLEKLKKFVSDMSGSNKENVPEENASENESPVLELTGENFVEEIKNGIAFVKFFAPWCGHCKRLAPTWEDLGKLFMYSKTVSIVKIDCTHDANKQLCNDEEIEGFPSLFLYKNGKKVSEYTGSRSLDDLYNFVNKHVTHDEL